jgi:hypothetical protein
MFEEVEEGESEKDAMEIAIWDYKRVEKMLDTQYNSDNSNKSVICDIIAMYLKGQKILYTEAKTVCEQRMNCLMLPAIFITSLCTILSLVLKDYAYGATIVSSLNGFNAFLLALISYLKLDAKAEAHRTSAYKFDKLQQSVIFNSGKAMFISIDDDEIENMIIQIENDVNEIRETNQFVLPENIRYSYPMLVGLNIFAEVKKIQTQEMLLINRLKDVLNDITILEQQTPRPPNYDSRMRDITQEQRDAWNQILKLRDNFLEIDRIFEEEMRMNRTKCSKRCQFCACLKV